MAGKAAKGKRSKSRYKISAPDKPTTVSSLMRDFPIGTRVAIVIDGSRHRGMPDTHFHGISGKIAGRQGRAFVVELKDGNKAKTVIAGPGHLKELK